LITECPIQFEFRRTVVKHVKPRPHWATVLVVENGDYIVAKRATMVAENSRRFRRL